MLACVCWAAVVILYLIYTQPYKVVKSCFGPSTQADAKAMMKAIVCLLVAICAIFIKLFALYELTQIRHIFSSEKF